MPRAALPSVAVVVSHPIQHFCPMYGSIARSEVCRIKVFFASSAGLNSQWDPNFQRHIRWEGLTLDFPHTFLNGGKSLPLGESVDAPDLERALDEYGPDVVTVYGYAQPLQRRARRWAISRGRRVFMTSDADNRRRQGLLKRMAKRIVLPGIYRDVDCFLTVGDANETQYAAYGARPEHMFRAPFPVDRDLLEPVFSAKRTHGRRLRSELAISEDALVISVIGKLVPWKRQHDLIEALALLDELPQRLCALIIGTGQEDGNLRCAMSRLRRQQVLLMGFVQPRDLARYYAATDIYVHASSVEPHSLAVSEAIYMGCPVIISDRCGSYGTTDDVQPGRNGFVYQCGDVSALAAAIRRLAESPPLRQEF